nr:uncharacterized protein LOC117277129 [Nicotiana tomentosiformis]
MIFRCQIYISRSTTVPSINAVRIHKKSEVYVDDIIIKSKKSADQIADLRKVLLVVVDSDMLIHQVLGEWATKNTKILPYLDCVQGSIKRFAKIEFKHVPQIQNEFADALATLSSMIEHLDKNYSDPIPIKAMCKTFKIKNRNFTVYTTQMNQVVKAANKNIKRILRNMMDNYKQWYEKLPLAFIG